MMPSLAEKSVSYPIDIINANGTQSRAGAESHEC